MRLSLLKERLAVCRLESASPVPGWLLESPFFTVSRTHDELSLVCPEGSVPEGILSNKGWRCLKIEGPIPFNLTGILASIAGPLANAKIPIFAFSTYDTDYILVKDADLEKAVGVLLAEGHGIRRE